MEKNSSLIKEYFDKVVPNAKCELNYGGIFQLLVAVILSAQTTDVSVNKVTPNLFAKYPNVYEMSLANNEDVESIIHPIGLYVNKAHNIIASAQEIQKRFDGKVPSNLDDLMTLPGVGRKTASVVLIEGFKIPAFPVDTHVKRVAIRLNLAPINADVNVVENNLRNLYPMQSWAKLHHQFIFFGRYYCMARNPKCAECSLKAICTYKK